MINVFENYEVLYNTILATTVMTNTYSNEAVADCKKIIDFICDAYHADEELKTKLKSVILKDLVPLGVMQDLDAFDASKTYYSEYTETDKCMEVKYEIIRALTEMRRSKPTNNYGFVNYDHYNVYQPNARFRKLSQSSMKGDLISTRQTAILKVLGIGCPIDMEDAKRKLFQCVMWGDLQSAYLLSHTMRLTNDEKKAELFQELAKLMETYLDDGITVLPESTKESFSEEARLYYIYVSSIKYDVVYAYDVHDIDFSFLEVMMSEDLDYSKKMTFINEYRDKRWKNITNAATEAQKKYKIGF